MIRVWRLVLHCQELIFLKERGAVEVPPSLRDQFAWDQTWKELKERWA